MELNRTFVLLRVAAALLGVPRAWLLAEVEAGRVPAVKAGRRWLVHLECARAALEAAATKGGAK